MADPEQLHTLVPAATLPLTGEWFVLHTKSRQEKLLAADLAARDLGVFLPLVPHQRVHGRRKVTVDLPMFPGYVFLRGNRDDTFTADRTRRIAQIISVADQLRLDWELRNIHMAMAFAAPLDPYPHLTEGIRVAVRSGPFRGLQGLIERRVRPERLILQVDMLGRGMSLEIDASLLDPIE
jgi:transcription antitermination factor NusG